MTKKSKRKSSCRDHLTLDQCIARVRKTQEFISVLDLNQFDPEFPATEKATMVAYVGRVVSSLEHLQTMMPQCDRNGG